MPEALAAAGAVCLIAAVIGGGLEASGFKVPIIPSRERQVLLFVLGIVLVGTGFAARQIPSADRSSGTSTGQGEPPVTVRPTEQSTEPPSPPRSNGRPPATGSRTPDPSISLPSPSIDVGSEVAAWRTATEQVCLAAAQSSRQAPDLLAVAEVLVQAAVALRAVQPPSEIASDAAEWYDALDETAEVRRQVANARVLGDSNTDFQLSPRGNDAARRANNARSRLGLGDVCLTAPTF